MPIIKCKCGRNTTFGFTCAFCSETFFLDPEVEKQEAELPEKGFGFHEVELDDDFKELLEED
jgi:hypothetical protein